MKNFSANDAKRLLAVLLTLSAAYLMELTLDVNPDLMNLILLMGQGLGLLNLAVVIKIILTDKNDSVLGLDRINHLLWEADQEKKSTSAVVDSVIFVLIGLFLALLIGGEFFYSVIMLEVVALFQIISMLQNSNVDDLYFTKLLVQQFGYAKKDKRDVIRELMFLVREVGREKPHYQYAFLSSLTREIRKDIENKDTITFAEDEFYSFTERGNFSTSSFDFESQVVCLENIIALPENYKEEVYIKYLTLGQNNQK